MRIRILKSLISTSGSFQAGTVVDLPDDIARNWIDVGIGMQEKSLDGGGETKAEAIKQERKHSKKR
jgi:hypothetical protein